MESPAIVGWQRVIVIMLDGLHFGNTYVLMHQSVLDDFDQNFVVRSFVASIPIDNVREGEHIKLIVVCWVYTFNWATCAHPHG